MSPQPPVNTAAPAGAVNPRAGNTPADVWMAQEARLFGRYVKRQKIALILLGAPALIPLFFIAPGVLTLSGGALSHGEADTLGTGSEILLILTLLITPVMTLTRWRWIFPLRRWYGVMMAFTAIGDAAIAAVTTDFAGGLFGRLAGHSFLLAGLVMTMLLIPLLLTANSWAQRWLGRYWPVLHRLVYVIWGLLLLHLALLEGFGYQKGLNGSGRGVDGTPIFHQRLYQFAACSAFLLVLRLPPVKRWIASKRALGRQKTVWLAVAPLILLFCFAFAFVVHEELFKGADMFRLHPSVA